jgi:hypothetical protein
VLISGKNYLEATPSDKGVPEGLKGYLLTICVDQLQRVILT